MVKTTKTTNEVLKAAVTATRAFRNPEVTSYHLLSCLIRNDKGKMIVRGAGGSPHKISIFLKQTITKLPRTNKSKKEPAVSEEFAKILSAAQKKTSDNIGVGHLLLALCESNELKACLSDIDKAMVVTTKDFGEALSKYSRNLTREAKLGKIDPKIGRDQEIRQAIQTLSRRTKNNPVIVGESGTGKTSIVEAIALRIANNDVPESLKGRSIIQLDLAALVAGAQYRGQFEERLKGVIDEVIKEGSKIILFIDDLHNLMSSGKSESGQDAASILKPALARGDIRCIGATSTDQYKKHIEKDKALERRFQAVRIEEPSKEESVSILRGLRDRYQVHYGLRITDSAITSAVALSSRYITGKFLPDKAIDTLDQACAELKMDAESTPAPIDQKERQLSQLKMEASAGNVDYEDQISELELEIKGMRVQWDKERSLFAAIKLTGEGIEEAKKRASTFKVQNKLAEASDVLYKEIPEFEEEHNKLIEELLEIQSGGSYLRDCVSEEDVAKIVSSWTGIPSEKMLQKKTQEGMMEMENRLHESVVGQHEPIVAISKAIRQSRAGLTDPNAPVGTFLFLGPTGVGKTEVAKSLANFLFDDESKMIRIDMSEYMEKHSVNRLIGSPPGYAGHEEGGQLTEAVRANPYSIILLDEAEKAHPDVFNIFLQVFDEGRLTDNHGRTVDFTNSIILMTSNIGSSLYYQDLEKEVLEKKREDVLKEHFRPEFLNRIDKIIYFHPLAEEHMKTILKIQMKSVHRRLKEKNLSLTLTEKAETWLSVNGYQPEYGARPLKRLIKEEVLNPLSDYILTQAPNDEVLTMDVDEDGKFFIVVE